ncbi:RNase adapter RapZ [Desulforegula conservatrix]|uniref:RNase adapter RapZ n=1 Tax=Desulforegula conservatrix TaxID=153026 RepID=UPI0003FCEEE1|nr:RNase adapter RapZ [Desulforegula conservatrix]
MPINRICIITGLSGSGKSTALDAFEDSGFYCVDNMPVDLLPKFLELPMESNTEINGFAFVMDLREKGFPSKCQSVFNYLKENGLDFEIIFLEADKKILVQRFSQTRRHHPLTHDSSLMDGITEEKSKLESLRNISDNVIDTTNTNVHELKSIVTAIARRHIKTDLLQISILSFGFKYGLPQGIDLLMDVRFLSNPYFVAELKDFSGKDEEVRNFVLNSPETLTFMKKYTDMLDYLIPLYKREGKVYLTIAIGCTGGRHRSVAVADEIAKHIREYSAQVYVTHRDLDREKKPGS